MIGKIRNLGGGASDSPIKWIIKEGVLQQGLVTNGLVTQEASAVKVNRDGSTNGGAIIGVDFTKYGKMFVSAKAGESASFNVYVDGSYIRFTSTGIVTQQLNVSSKDDAYPITFNIENFTNRPAYIYDMYLTKE